MIRIREVAISSDVDAGCTGGSDPSRVIRAQSVGADDDFVNFALAGQKFTSQPIVNAVEPPTDLAQLLVHLRVVAQSFEVA